MKSLIVVAVAALSCVAFAEGPEGGQRPEGPHRGFGPRDGFGPMMGGDPIVRMVSNPAVAEKIGLSDEQKAKLKDLKSASESNREAQKKGIHVTGEAHSAASIIAMAGWCEMAPTALMMVHCVSSYADGNHNDMEHAAEVLRTADKALCTAYTEKTGMTEEEALAMMERETWLRAADAKNLGLIDEIMFDSGEQPTLSNSTFKLPTRDQMERARAMMERRDSGNKDKIQTQLNLLRLDARRLQK